MKIREPENQYDFEAKRQYREAVWRTFAENVRDVGTAKVLFFPGRHGFEIEVALRHGFKEENLIACEENPAIIATAQWRQHYPKIRCYGTPLLRTLERLNAEGVILDAANLDFCSNVCRAVLDDLHGLLEKQTRWPLTIAVTLLKGRESTALVDIGRLVCRQANGSLDRILLVRKILQNPWRYLTKPIISAEYRSKSKNMAYGVFQVATNTWLEEEFVSSVVFPNNAEVEALLELDAQIFSPQSFKQYQRLREEFYQRRSVLQETAHKFWVAMWGWGGNTGIDASHQDIIWRWYVLMKTPQRRYKPPLQGSKEHEEEVREMRRLLVKSESEKAQLLQAGRAWR